MCEMLLSNQQLIEGSPALQEVSTLCDGLERDEYGVVIDRVNKRVQSVVDKLVELPLHRDVPAASYARLGGHTYRVEQTQTGEDGDGLPVTWLSLMRMEDAYDAY